MRGFRYPTLKYISVKLKCNPTPGVFFIFYLFIYLFCIKHIHLVLLVRILHLPLHPNLTSGGGPCVKQVPVVGMGTRCMLFKQTLTFTLMIDFHIEDRSKEKEDGENYSDC